MNGKIVYYFKGKKMSSVNSTVVKFLDADNILVANRYRELPLTFVRKDNIWLLKHNAECNSLLFGTSFVFDNDCF